MRSRVPHQVRPAVSAAGKVGRILFALFMVALLAAFASGLGATSLSFGLVASFSLLGLFDLLMPLVRLRMPASLQVVTAAEYHGRINRVAGVAAFGSLLRGSPLRLLNRRVYLRAQAGDFGAVRAYVEDAEAAHFWAGVATLLYLVLLLWHVAWSTFFAVAAFNVVVNLYPMLHLRMVRFRLGRVTNAS